MAKRSLGTHWRERTPQERGEFERLFADLLERSYYQKLDAYTDQEVRYTSEEMDGGGGVVRTKIVSNKEKLDIPIDYKVLRRDGQWKVYDIAIEGAPRDSVSATSSIGPRIASPWSRSRSARWSSPARR